MRNRRVGWWVALGAVVSAAAPMGSVEAAAKSGCPAANSGWTRHTVEEVAAIVLPELVEPLPIEELEAAIRAGADKNGDDLVCLDVLWGDSLNPKSHWYRAGGDDGPIFLFVAVDNNANANDN